MRALVKSIQVVYVVREISLSSKLRSKLYVILQSICVHVSRYSGFSLVDENAEKEYKQSMYTWMSSGWLVYSIGVCIFQIK